jgi:hypothetical protein
VLCDACDTSFRNMCNPLSRALAQPQGPNRPSNDVGQTNNRKFQRDKRKTKLGAFLRSLYSNRGLSFHTLNRSQPSSPQEETSNNHMLKRDGFPSASIMNVPHCLFPSCCGTRLQSSTWADCCFDADSTADDSHHSVLISILLHSGIDQSRRTDADDRCGSSCKRRASMRL